MFHFRKEDYRMLGIAFRWEEETQAFADIVRGELEERIGSDLSDRMTEEQLRAFDEIIDRGEEAGVFLETNCPDYRNVVKMNQEKLKKELLEYRPRIAGLVRTRELDERSRMIDDLPLQQVCLEALHKTGIDTCGELSVMSSRERQHLNDLLGEAHLQEVLRAQQTARDTIKGKNVIPTV